VRLARRFRAQILPCQFIEPIDDLGLAATLIDEATDPIATGAATLVTSHAQQVEPAGEVAEYDCAVAGYDNLLDPVLDRHSDIGPAKIILDPFWTRSSVDARSA
jgi:hypothetical protein